MSIGNDICNNGVHCLGNVYSEAIWSLYKRTLRAAPYYYDENTSMEIVTRLTFIAGKFVYTYMNSFVLNPSRSQLILNFLLKLNVQPATSGLGSKELLLGVDADLRLVIESFLQLMVSTSRFQLYM